MRKYTYYFVCGEDDTDITYDVFDDEAWIDELLNSAKIIHCLISDKQITKHDFDDMVRKAIINIFSAKSTIYDYPQDFYKYDLWEQINEDDIFAELCDLYDIHIYSSVVPLIWGDDCWEDDENYDEDNPPELWHIEFDYGNIDEEKYREGAIVY